MACSSLQHPAALSLRHVAGQSAKRGCRALAVAPRLALTQGGVQRTPAFAFVANETVASHSCSSSRINLHLGASSFCRLAQEPCLVVAQRAVSTVTKERAGQLPGAEESELQQLTVEILKARCRAAGLRVSGSKSALIRRLLDNEGAQEVGIGCVMDLDRMTVVQLKQELKALGLPTSGLKSVLRSRLQSARGSDGNLRSEEALIPDYGPSTASMTLAAKTEDRLENLRSSIGQTSPIVTSGVVDTHSSQEFLSPPRISTENTLTSSSTGLDFSESSPGLPPPPRISSGETSTSGTSGLEAVGSSAGSSSQPRTSTEQTSKIGISGLEVTPNSLELSPARSSTEQTPTMWTGGKEATRHSPELLSPRHVLIVLMGIQGSGKSTLCKLLGSIFRGSVWVNQDETGRSGGARHRFLEAVRRSMEAAILPGGLPRLVLVDKMNHQQRHRADLAQQVAAARWREHGGRILLVQFSPPEGHWPLNFIESRIEQRGVAHRSLAPSKDLTRILCATTAQAEPLAPHERSYFDSVLTFDIRLNTIEKALHVVAELFRMGWVGALQWRVASGRCQAELEDTGPSTLGHVPHWVQTLPFRGRRDSHVEDWDDLRDIFQCEWERLQEEEETWRKRESITELGYREFSAPSQTQWGNGDDLHKELHVLHKQGASKPFRAQALHIRPYGFKWRNSV